MKIILGAEKVVPFNSKQPGHPISVSKSERTAVVVTEDARDDYDVTAAPKKGAKHIVQIGCGVVGSAYMKAFKSKGHQVTGIEVSPRIINDLGSDFKMYNASSNDVSHLSDVDLILLSVCTPVKAENGRLDMSYLYDTIENVAVLVKNNPNSAVVIRSTVPPGTVAKYKKALTDQLGGNHQVQVCFQPEFLRAASAYADATNPWYVIIGTPGGADPPTALYDIWLDFADEAKIKVMTAEEAELHKIFHNSFNACKISFFNQCDLLCKEICKREEASNINTDVITEALVHTCEGLMNAQYGTKTGHAYYGSCLPKDSKELKGLEAEYGLASSLFKEVVKVNDEVAAIDKAENRGEILHGDFHKPCFALK